MREKLTLKQFLQHTTPVNQLHVLVQVINPGTEIPLIAGSHSLILSVQAGYSPASAYASGYPFFQIICQDKGVLFNQIAHEFIT
ncbi:MAG: hypothetical protein MZV63_62385 [Marinilabiliales bacterium]|nr:hypothetical protein [Marinilabiliales bacterium]